MVTLKDILSDVQFEQVMIDIVDRFPNQRKCFNHYKEAFNELCKMKPVSSDMTLIIEMQHNEDVEDEEYEHLYFRRENDDTPYGGVDKPWAEWLGSKIGEDTLKSFSKTLIVALSLFEMTYFGWSEEQVQMRFKEMEEDAANGEPMSMEELKQLLGSDDSDKRTLRLAGRWVRWGNFSKVYFGENAMWFDKNFVGRDAPSNFAELDKHTLKAALKEIGLRIVQIAEDL